MKNIFENAKFGDKYVTPYDEIVLYLYQDGDVHYLVTEKGIKFCCQSCGAPLDDMSASWIVESRYMNEEKLDKLANQKAMEYSHKFGDSYCDYLKGFKDGVSYLGL